MAARKKQEPEDRTVFVANQQEEMPPDVVELIEEFEIETREKSDESTGVSHEESTVRGPSRPDGQGVCLNRWVVMAHQYEDKTEAKAGFLGIGSVAAKTLEKGLIQEAKRFVVRNSKAKRKVEFGVAVRLWIAVSNFSGKATLTVPNLAASAQIGLAKAKIGISVEGFDGPLGDLLPAPEELNVENFTTYTSAFKKIQAHVLGENGKKWIAPTMLGYHVDKKQLPV